MEGGPPVFPTDSTCLLVLWILDTFVRFRLQDFHFLWCMLSNILRLSSKMLIPVRTPSVLLLSVWPLSLSLATTREISVDFSSSGYLDVSVPQVPLINLCIQLMIYDSSSYVFPHSEIHGSRLICSSPWLIAACHVFLRLLMPRHSPYALVCLNSF